MCSNPSRMSRTPWPRTGAVTMGQASRDYDATRGGEQRTLRVHCGSRPSARRRISQVWWEALGQWGEDVARVERLAGGVANDV
jgi:hypothetical protein